jgi:predicted flap endonuclease-1-like 5' DNA nuclease
MPHLILEIILWVLLAFFIGCVLGALARSLTARRPEQVQAASETSDVADTDTGEAVSTARIDDEMVSAAISNSRAERPTGIAEPRGGKSDNLQRISGIGPKNERTLHSLGFFHFDQIAGWTDEEVNWVDNHLKFNGRIVREEWIMQASLLADGKDEEFERLYGGRRSRPVSDKQGTIAK